MHFLTLEFVLVLMDKDRKRRGEQEEEEVSQMHELEKSLCIVL